VTGVADLEDDFAQLAEARRKLDREIPRKQRDRFTDPFFAVLDQLVQQVPDAEPPRSVLILTFHRTAADGEDASLVRVF
jgi:hypothetical protein